MAKIRIFIAFCTIIIFTNICVGESVGNKVDSLNVELKFFPTGVPESMRFSVKIVQNKLVAKSYRNSTGLKVDSLILKPEEVDSLIYWQSRIKEFNYYNESYTSDCWGAQLFINKTLIFNDELFYFGGNPESIKAFISYIVKLSPIKIKLYRF